MSELQKNERSTLLSTLLHLSVWGLLFIFPLFIVDFGGDDERYYRFVKRSLLTLATNSIVFYINYYFWIGNWYFNKRYALYIIANSLLIAVVITVSMIIYMYFIHPQNNDHGNSHSSKFSIYLKFFWDYLFYFMNIGVAIAIVATNRLAKEEQKLKSVENDRLKSELSYLKYQLQPHFFFNTLNNIYALIDAYPDRAKDTVLKLSKLMRYLLYKSDDKSVPLLDEINFLKNYIELMRIRYGDHVEIQSSYPESVSAVKVPPLLLIPLIENAFKHGVDAIQPSFISIQLQENNSKLELLIQNSFYPKAADDESGSGIGLENLKKRLDLLYKENTYSFEQHLEGKTYHTKLQIPL